MSERELQEFIKRVRYRDDVPIELITATLQRFGRMDALNEILSRRDLGFYFTADELLSYGLISQESYDLIQNILRENYWSGRRIRELLRSFNGDPVVVGLLLGMIPNSYDGRVSLVYIIADIESIENQLSLHALYLEYLHKSQKMYQLSDYMTLEDLYRGQFISEKVYNVARSMVESIESRRLDFTRRNRDSMLIQDALTPVGSEVKDQLVDEMILAICCSMNLPAGMHLLGSRSDLGKKSIPIARGLIRHGNIHLGNFGMKHLSIWDDDNQANLDIYYNILRRGETPQGQIHDATQLEALEAIDRVAVDAEIADKSRCARNVIRYFRSRYAFDVPFIKIIEILGHIGPTQEAIEFLFDFVENPRYQSQWQIAAIEALSEITDADQLDLLLFKVINAHYNEEQTRYYAAAMLRSPNSIPAMIELFRTENFSIQTSLLDAIQEMKPIRAVPFLWRLRNDEDQEDHHEAVDDILQEMGMLDRKKRHEAFLLCREDPDPVIRKLAGAKE